MHQITQRTAHAALAAAVLLTAACSTTDSRHTSTGGVPADQASKRYNVALHLLANSPTLISLRFTANNTTYKPTASDAQLKQATANSRVINEQLIKGIDRRLPDAAQRHGAEIRRLDSRYPVLDVSVLTSHMLCQDSVCRSFKEMKTDVVNTQGQVIWTYKSRFELPPVVLDNDSTGFDNFTENLLDAMQRDGLFGR